MMVVQAPSLELVSMDWEANISWVAVKEPKLSYHIGETLYFIIYTQYGNLI